MHIGNKIFPYPVLNHDKDLTDYEESTDFMLCFDTDKQSNGQPIIENGKINFKNLHYELNDPTLKEMISEGKISAVFMVECSHSLYRNHFPITEKPCDLKIDVKNFSGEVITSAYLYATQNIQDFRSDRFQRIYRGFSCSIDKFDILAVDDGFKFPIDLNPVDAKNISSIFTIVRKEENDNLLTYRTDGTKIIIEIPAKQYASYEAIKGDSRNNNIAFAMLAIPALASCLKDLELAAPCDLTDLAEDKRWLYSIIYQYKNITGDDFTIETLVNRGSLEIAQIVLNNAICNGIRDFESILYDLGKDDGDEDE